MSPRPARSRLVFLPVLLLLIGTTACYSYRASGPGTIMIRILAAGGRGADGLGIEHCKRAVKPNEILKNITVRDGDGMEVARMTVRGRDTTAKKVGVNGRRCIVMAVKMVEAQKGADYEITADGEVISIRWQRMIDKCISRGGPRPGNPSGWGREDCIDFYDDVTIGFPARGTESGPSERLGGRAGLNFP